MNRKPNEIADLRQPRNLPDAIALADRIMGCDTEREIELIVPENLPMMKRD